MANFAIKGHATRGKEVIEILEMLGGKNELQHTGSENNKLYIIKNGEIHLNFITFAYCFNVFTIEEFLEKFPYKVGDKVQRNGATSCGSVYVIEQMKWEDNQVKYFICDLYWKNCKCTVISKDLQPYKDETMDDVSKSVFDVNAQCCDIMNHLIKEETMEEQIKIDIPKGYEFAGVDDDAQQVVFEKVKPKYPKTYDECCEILDILGNINIEGYKKELLLSLQKLLICRDAYWKVAGEQMGLDKPWEPDFTNDKQERYGIYTAQNNITLEFYGGGDVNLILTFPTEEMRDAFSDSKEIAQLIENCKEFL